MNLRRIYTVVLIGLAALSITGCATRECASVCFSPVTPYQPASAEELRARLNERMPVPVPKSDFYCHQEDGQFVAWVILDNASRQSAVTRVLRRAPDLRLLSVGYFAPADRNMFVSGAVPENLVSIDRSN